MEQPKGFFIETYENVNDNKQIGYFNDIIELILQNGYVIKKMGKNEITKKYVWEFIKADKVMTENYIPMEWSKIPIKDEKYHTKADEENERAFCGESKNKWRKSI